MDNLRQLNTIKKVSAPDTMYQEILDKLTQKHLISWKWMKVAAVLLIGLGAIEYYAIEISKADVELSQLAELIPTSENRLYYD